jgi:lipopolysaccharide transport system permease protein
MVILIESYRDVLMYQRWPSFTGLGVLALASLLLVAVGHGLIRRYDQEFPKVSM